MANGSEPTGTKRKAAACAADAEDVASAAKASAVAAPAPDASVPESPFSEVAEPKSEEPSTSFGPNPNSFEDGYLPDAFDDFWDAATGGQQCSDFVADDAVPKVPYVGDKEPLSALAAEFQLGSPIIQEKIKLLGEQYDALRRTRGDGNCFYRSFMFSYLEQLLEKQDKHEVDRVLVSIEQCKKTLQSLGYTEFTYDDFFAIFIEQLESVIPGSQPPISHEELVLRSRDQSISDYVVMFFRFITAGEIRRRAEFFEPFVAGLTNSSIDQFCKASVEPMGEESDHVHITALSDALGVPIRVVYLDRSSCDAGPTVNHHDFIPSSSNNGATDISGSDKPHPPKPFVTLLYRPGHYDILYPNRITS